MDTARISTQLRHVSVYPNLGTTEAVHKSHHDFSSTKENPSRKNSERTKKDLEDGEIGVFSAEKYFSMKLDHPRPGENDTFATEYLSKQESRGNPTRMRPRSRHGTPSIRSQSSYSSQTVLLRSSERTNPSQNRQRKTNQTSISFSGLRCNGPCSGRKSVNINRSRKDAPHGREHFNKPRLQMKNAYPRAISAFAKVTNGAKIEEFFPLPNEKVDIAMNLERKLSMLTWDAIPNSPNHLPINKTSNSVSGQTCEDVESDASSDLFEIENITYEPSEASFEWSVATGSMADFSVASDFEERKLAEFNRRKNSVPGAETKPGPLVEKRRSRGLLSGCKSHKAVNVVEAAAAYKSEKRGKGCPAASQSREEAAKI